LNIEHTEGSVQNCCCQLDVDLKVTKGLISVCWAEFLSLKFECTQQDSLLLDLLNEKFHQYSKVSHFPNGMNSGNLSTCCKPYPLLEYIIILLHVDLGT